MSQIHKEAKQISRTLYQAETANPSLVIQGQENDSGTETEKQPKANEKRKRKPVTVFPWVKIPDYNPQRQSVENLRETDRDETEEKPKPKERNPRKPVIHYSWVKEPVHNPPTAKTSKSQASASESDGSDSARGRNDDKKAKIDPKVLEMETRDTILVSPGLNRKQRSGEMKVSDTQIFT